MNPDSPPTTGPPQSRLQRLLHSRGRLTLSEVSGSLGDVGTLIPLLVGMAKNGYVDFVPALFFAGLFNMIGGASWDLPMCVQPMKTIAAVALTHDQLTRVQVTLAGMLVGGIVLILGVTRLIVVVNNVVPMSVVRGMQLGLGLSLVKKGVLLVLQASGGKTNTGNAGRWFNSVDCYATAGLCFLLTLMLTQRKERKVPAALITFSIGLVLALIQVPKPAIS
jgi:MFS superfamily sulfate permease-like transporter